MSKPKTSKPEILAIIPARGGSKGIPRKNIRPFAGYPLIAYSIAAGLQAETVTRTIVSTDDEEIAEVARRYGAEIPFMRPAELAQDRTTDLPVFQHALRWLEEHEGYCPEVVVQLRPPAPFRSRSLVDDAVRLLLDHPEADAVRGIVPAGESPYKMWLIPEEGGPMKPLLTMPGVKESYNAPRQIFPPIFWHAGHIDVIRPKTLLELNSMSGEKMFPLVIEADYSADLDTLEDWKNAEWRAIHEDLDIVRPGKPPRPMPATVDLIVLDFDGVLTDNRVWVDQDGREMVAAYRSDSLGIWKLREAGVETVVLSMETNPVVAARCNKMKTPYIQGENDKASALKKLMAERNVDPAHVAYLGNDVNDLPCFPLVGWAVAVADALPEVARRADFVLSLPGGRGAVRELCDLVMSQNSRSAQGNGSPR